MRHGAKYLQDAFSLEQNILVDRLKLSQESLTHEGIKGEVNEKHFTEVLRRYLPERYKIASGIVIDATGKTSDQIDVVIYDRFYTPTLLDQQQHSFIPAESVYAVFEAKPKISKGNISYAAEKAESVRKLARSSTTIVNAGIAQEPRPLFPIVAGILAIETDWKEGLRAKAFRRHIGALKRDQLLDCGFVVSGECFEYTEDEILVTAGDNELAYFLFRLLHRLQSMGTVAAVNWSKYADALR